MGNFDEAHVEILMNMDDEDLIIMADFYRDHKQLGYASSCLVNGSRLKKAINTFPIRFVSPVGAWEVNGTFFMIVEVDYCYEISIFSGYLNSESSVQTISNALAKTHRINFESTKYIVFKDIHHSFHHLVTNFIQSKGLQVETEETFHILRMEKKLALDFHLNVPDEVQLRSLQPDDGYEIRAYWPHFYPPTDDYFRILIQANGGYGLFSKKDGELLSWAIKTMSGTIGYVQTVERAQKRGYATLIVRLMAKELVFEHQYPVIMVLTSDDDSLNFFEGIGFQTVGLSHNTYLKQKKPKEEGNANKEKKGKIHLPFSFKRLAVGNPSNKDIMEAGPSWASNPGPLETSGKKVKQKRLPRKEFTDIGKKPTPITDALLGPSIKPPSRNTLKRNLVAVKKATVRAVSTSLNKLGIKKEQRPSPHSPSSTPSSALRNYSINPSPGSSRSSSRSRRSSSRRSSSRGSTKPPTPRSEKFSDSSSSHRSRKESYSSSYSNRGSGSIQKIDIKGKTLKSKTIKKKSRSTVQVESQDSKPKESTSKSELENERSASETKASTKDTLEDLGSSDEYITGTGTKDDSIKLLSTKAGKKPVSTKSMTHLNTNPEGTEFCSMLKPAIRYLSTKSLTRINPENDDMNLLPLQRKTDYESDDSDSEEKGKLLPSSSNKSKDTRL